jgi:G3E family GTPase
MVSGDSLAGVRYSWDSVVTLVDGVSGVRTMETHAAAAQVAAADHVIITKTDLADGASTDALESRLRILNTDAAMHRAANGVLGASLSALMRPAPGAASRREGFLRTPRGAPVHDPGLASC